MAQGINITISGSGNGGVFSWTPSEDVQNLFSAIKRDFGHEFFDLIEEDLKGRMQAFFHLLCGSLVYPRATPELMDNIGRHMIEMLKESVNILEKHKKLGT